MIDVINLRVMGFPVLMYAMIIATTGAIAFATAYPISMPSMGSLPSFPSANPLATPGMPNSLPPGPPGAPPAGPPPPQVQGGKKHKRKTQHKKRSPKKRSPKKRTAISIKKSTKK